MQPIFKKPVENSKKLLYRMYLSYSLLIFLLLLVGLYFYHSAITNAEEQIRQQNIYSLESKVEDFDTSFYMLSSFASQISSNSNIRKLMITDTISTSFYINSSSAIKYLSEIMCMQSALPITNCYIYLPKTEYIILPTASMTAYNYYNYRKKYAESHYLEWLDYISLPENSNRFLPLADYLDMDSEPDSYLYVCSLYTGNAVSQPEGFFCFTIDKEQLLTGFAGLNLEDDSCLYIQNTQNGDTYSLYYEDNVSYDPQALIREFKANNGLTTYEYEGNEYIITQKESEYNQWNYYLIQSASGILSDFYSYKRLFQLLIILVGSFSFLGLLLIGKQSIKPYVEIQNKLESTESEKETLHNELLNQRPYVYNAYLSRILSGNLDNITNIDKILSFLKLNFVNNYYSVLYIIVVPSYDKISEVLNDTHHSTLELDGESRSINEIIESSIREYWGNEICIYRPEPMHYALVLPIGKESSLYDSFALSTKETFHKMQTILEEQHNILIGGGLGKANARVNYIWESYHLAKEAVSFIGKNHPFQCYKNIIRGNDVYYYPNQLEEQLGLFITSGNSRQTAEIFKLLLNENFELRDLPFHVQEWLISDLRNTLVKLRYEMKTTEKNQAQLSRLDEMMLSIKTVDDEEKIALFMASLHENSEEKNQLITRIEQYLIENYHEQDLSLKKISEVFEISENYFSSLFKSETKQNFSEYLEHLRMGHAMVLLKNGTVNVSDIYSKVGYNNSNSFRRAFKKTYGVSPSSVTKNDAAS